MPMNLPDSNAKVDTDGKGRHPSEESDQQQQSANQFGECGNVTQPGGKPHTSNHVGEVPEAAKDFVVAVNAHNCAERQPHDKKRQGFEAIEITQVMPPKYGID